MARYIGLHPLKRHYEKSLAKIYYSAALPNRNIMRVTLLLQPRLALDRSLAFSPTIIGRDPKTVGPRRNGLYQS